MLALYGCLSLLTDPGGTLGTDTGAKVATLDHMVETGSWRPDVGYWAEEWDPDGAYHPLFDTFPNDEGEWVNVTTLPMLLAARPLYEAGGYRFALVLPMLGAIAAALAGRDIARRLADERAGEWAFWILATGSPLVVYALDLWEHAPGVGLMLWGVAALLRLVDGGAVRWALLAGVLFGASSAMRTETFLVTLVSVAAACVALVVRRQLLRSVAAGLASIVGFAGPWLANVWLERGLGGNARATRVSGAAQREFWTEASDRGKEALITWFGLPGLGYPDGVLVGMLIAAAITGAFVLHRRDRDREARLAAALGCGLFVVVLVTAGPAFVSGAFMASPVAIAGIWAARDGGRPRAIAGAAVVATAGIWAFQFLGGAGPQWGGRYILVPTLVLTVLGVMRLRRGVGLLGPVLVGMGVFVNALGVIWLVERSHEVDGFFETLAERPEDVLISTNGFLVREAGDAYDARLYLSLGRGSTLEGAVAVVEDAGFDSYAIVSFADDLPEPPPGDPGPVESLSFLGATLYVHPFDLRD